MAKLNFGIFGPLSGKLGALVGGTWKGIPYIKKVADYRKGRPRTPAQLANEAKFKYVNDWLIPFHPFVSIGFENLAMKSTAVSVAFSKIYNTVFSGIAPDLIVDYSQMVISAGPLTVLGDPEIVFTSQDTIQVTWKKNSGKGSHFDDQVMVALYSPKFKSIDGFIGTVNRSAEQYSYTIGQELIDTPLHAYIGVASLNRKQISNSQYLGELMPL